MILYILELETKIGLKPFFTKNHFGKREDGFWCVKPNATESIELECMPSNKGGKKFDDENRYTISGSDHSCFLKNLHFGLQWLYNGCTIITLLNEYKTKHERNYCRFIKAL